MNVDKELDVRNMNCPMPVVLTRKALKPMAENEVLKVTATDPAAVKDLDAFARSTGNELLASEEADGELRFYIRKHTESAGAESSACEAAAPLAQCG